MADRLSKEKRSWNMSRIHGADTSIEVKVRKYLYHAGFRYRKNDKRFPGKPDIVLPRYKCVVFIHGCFWHNHSGCKGATIPKTRTEFWMQKLNRNVCNDSKHTQLLEDMGWRVLVVWECEIKKAFEITMAKLIGQIRDNSVGDDK